MTRLGPITKGDSSSSSASSPSLPLPLAVPLPGRARLSGLLLRCEAGTWRMASMQLILARDVSHDIQTTLHGYMSKCCSLCISHACIHS